MQHISRPPVSGIGHARGGPVRARSGHRDLPWLLTFGSLRAQGCGHSRCPAAAAPGLAGRVPCAPRNAGRLRCRRPGAFAPEPQGFSPVRRLRRRTAPALLRCSAPQRRASGCTRSLAGGTEVVGGWKSTVMLGKAGAGLRGGAYAAPRSAARRGESARRADRREALRSCREGGRTAASQPPRWASTAGDLARRARRRIEAATQARPGLACSVIACANSGRSRRRE